MMLVKHSAEGTRAANQEKRVNQMSTVLFDAIKAQAKITDSVLVGFSGGKDSIVTLDLCFRYFKNVRVFFMYMVEGLSFQEKLLQWYEKKYDTEIIRVPHFENSYDMRFGVFRQMDYDVSYVTITDVYNYVRLQTDIHWIACGERIDDSIIRRAMIKNSSSIDKKRGRFYPVAYWSKRDVMEYIKFHKLKMGDDSKEFGFSFAALDGRQLTFIKNNYPDDYEKILKIYPFAEAAVKRLARYGK